MADESALTSRLQTLGLTEKSIKETLKNKKLASAFSGILNTTALTNPVDPKVVSGLTYLATQTKDTLCPRRDEVVKAIVDGRLKSNLQIMSAVEYLRGLESEGKISTYTVSGMEAASGVGVEFTKDQIAEIVAGYVAKNKERIVEERYRVAQETLSALKNTTALKWAPPLEVKLEVDRQFESLIGKKDERDVEKKKTKAKPAAKGGAQAKKKEEKAAGADPLNTTSMFEEGFLANLHKPGGNYQVVKENREKHLRETGGKVFTRFPPEVRESNSTYSFALLIVPGFSQMGIFILVTVRPLQSTLALRGTMVGSVIFAMMIRILKLRRRGTLSLSGRLSSGWASSHMRLHTQVITSRGSMILRRI